jgi:hypothetical protein
MLHICLLGQTLDPNLLQAIILTFKKISHLDPYIQPKAIWDILYQSFTLISLISFPFP